MPLTDQKRRYAEARMAGATKKQSAITAGCPEKTASQAASRYEKDADVKSFMARKNKLESAADPEEVATVSVPSSEIDIQEDPYIPRQAADPMEYLILVMNDMEADPKQRLDAAKSLLPYKHQKLEDAGKKKAAQDAAQQASTGRFASAPPPLRRVK
jgi:phage terminase small subunit